MTTCVIEFGEIDLHSWAKTSKTCILRKNLQELVFIFLSLVNKKIFIEGNIRKTDFKKLFNLTFQIQLLLEMINSSH